VQLKINGEPVDFTLEKEVVVSDVLKGVEEWLGNSGFLVTAVLMGDKNLLSSPRPEWEAIPLSSVAYLDFRVRPTGDVRIEHWSAIFSWLGSLSEAVFAGSPALEVLLQGFDGTLETLKKNPFLPEDQGEIGEFSGMFLGQSAETVRKWPRPRIEEAVSLIFRLRKALGRCIEEASHPREALRVQIQGLRESQGKLRELSVLLQTGRDRQAMQTVVDFSDLVQKLLALMRFLPKDPDRERLIGELNPVLRELISAFDAKDLVLIGDLFEYEIAPRIERLLPILERCS
jgi:hypothetical protein